jgi:hypothetical protein
MFRTWGGLFLAVVCTALLLPSRAAAQAAQASIVGVVQDSSGGVLPGVTVEASSPALIEQSRSVVTDTAGRYAIVDLRPGTYAVTFALPGFKTVKRDGIVLEGSFAATVNAALEVGAVEETIEVTGATPVVDVQNTRTQVVVNQNILQALPVMRSIQDQANLIPGVVSRSTSAGQILSDFYINSISARGATDQRISYDGFRNDMMLGGGGQAIAGGVNELGQTEMVYDIGGQSAEFATAGVRMDAIPKDGGNQFSGTWRFFGSNHNLQSDNLTDELRAKGIKAVNKLDFNWDNNVAVGGPIKRNKIWYFTAFELSQFNILVANVFFKDGTQADTGGHVKPNGTARITAQATGKDKVSFAYNNTTSLTDRYDFNASQAPEAGLRVNSPLNYSGIVKWTRTQTSRLLIEAGQSIAASTYHWEYQPEVGPYEVAKVNATIGYTYNASNIAPVENFNRSNTTLANVSYVTGSHALKTGISFTNGWGHTKVERHGDIRELIFQNIGGVPTSALVTVSNSPVDAKENLKADFGMYAQDKWTLDKLTLTFGGRFDYLNAYVPANTAPAGRFVPARSSNEITCVPCWKDWSVRFGSAYDLFGNGKTALRFSVGKYLASQALARAENVDPIRSQTEMRQWIDRDGNGSALDANGNAQYNEIGASPNANFGLPAGQNRFDPTTPRPTNWEESVSVSHQILPRVAVTGGYYRRDFQNQTITRNVAIDEVADYTPYSIVAPTDPRLGANSGEVIPRFNLLPSKAGIVDNVSTYSTLNKRKYNGFEVSANARLPKNGFLLGGITTERTYTNDCDPDGINPDSLRFCERTPPFRTLYKVSGGVTVPFDIQLSGSLQAVPGSDVAANFSYNGGYAGVALTTPTTRTLNLLEPNTNFLDYQTQLDGRVARSFRFGTKRLQAYMDFFNLLNASTVVSVNQTFGSGAAPTAANPSGVTLNANYLIPQVIMQARRLQFGARFDF